MNRQLPTIHRILAAAGAAAAIALTSAAGAHDEKPITAKPLTERHAFIDDVSMRITQKLDGLPEQVVELSDASHLTVVEFTIRPGAVFPWHTHPGTVLINIAEGEFVFMFAEDCVEREYGPGSAVVDPGNTVHTSYNPSTDEDTVVTAVLLGVPGEGALTIPVSDKENAALDEKCGIDRE